MLNMPATLTEDGDIRLHAKEGLYLPMLFEEDDGSVRDMTGEVVKLEIKGGPTFTLTETERTDQMTLTIPKGALNAFIGKAADFALVEYSQPPTVHWSGKIFVTGFA